MHSAPPIDGTSGSADVVQRPLPASLALGSSQSRKHRASANAVAGAAPARGADYVTIPVAAAMTGYSAKAIRRKIEAGVWLEGREFRRAPDGHVLISVKGYESWVERGRV